MFDLNPTFVLGFHGCSRDFGEKILLGETKFLASENDYDWLGHGVYFWEKDPIRGLEFATNQKKIDDPFVVGAIIDLGRCCDLTTRAAIEMVQTAYADLQETIVKSGADPLPQNSHGEDNLLRKRDCAVIQYMHTMIKKLGDPEFDSIKGIFQEGLPAFDGAGIMAQTHVQVCVRNDDCIKGVFRVRE